MRASCDTMGRILRLGICQDNGHEPNSWLNLLILATGGESLLALLRVWRPSGGPTVSHSTHPNWRPRRSPSANGPELIERPYAESSSRKSPYLT
jgi:hypothetical protein